MKPVRYMVCAREGRPLPPVVVDTTETSLRAACTSPFPEDIPAMVELPVSGDRIARYVLRSPALSRCPSIVQALGVERVLCVAVVAALTRLGHSVTEVEVACAVARPTERRRALEGFLGATRLHCLIAAIRTRCALNDPRNNANAYEESLAYALGAWAADP